MQLIADAFEQGLIVESEKNAFMETLLVSGTEAKQKPDRGTVEQMERSLRELLESSGNDAPICDQQKENSPPVLLPEEGDAGEEAPTRSITHSSSSAREHAADSDVWRPLTTQPQEDTQRMTIADEASAADQGARSVASARSAAAPPESTENSIATPDLQATSMTSAAVQGGSQQEQGNGDEWVKWLGGSLAVIGAVAGGVAIANTSRREDDSSSRQNNTASQSTVYIEELDGDTDENTDEWVAVSQDEND
jgi:hypothetical protein